VAGDGQRDERASAEELLPQVYDELRGLAGGFLRGERAEHTLQPTALVHEAWMRVLRQSGVAWRNPGHLRAVCAQAMRRVLVDHARARKADKRGGGQRPVTLRTDLVHADDERELDVLTLDLALEKLAGLDERQARIIELRFFGGLTNREVAEALELSETTVEDQWRFARAWLARELTYGV
jgi:RNA polymerase sigma factor (TIGR02999 family)